MPSRVTWYWDADSHRYRYASGRVVPLSYVKNDVWRVAHAARSEFRGLTISLRNGDITLQKWYDDMRAGMKSYYRASFMRDQYAYLNNFAAGIRDGSVMLDGRAVVRAGMYGDAAAAIYENALHRTFISKGFQEGRRVLGVAEHCPDCTEYASRGWVPIASVPPIGDSQCLVNCHCTIGVRSLAPDSSVEGVGGLQ